MTTTAAMPTTSASPVPIRVYAKRPKARRWQLLGVFDTREAAWSAIVAVPRGFAVWLNDQTKPQGRK